MVCVVHGVARSWTQLSDFHFQAEVTLAWMSGGSEDGKKLLDSGYI